MLRAGVSYGDWRLMTRWQRMEFLARKSRADKKMFKAMDGAGLGKVIGVVITRLMGL